MSWDRQRLMWEGMVAEGLVQTGQSAQGDEAPQMPVRQIESGAEVIDIRAMIRDSQAAQNAAASG